MTAQTKTPSTTPNNKSKAPTAPLWAWSAVDLAAGIRSKAISAREAVQSALDRVAEVNPKLNAIVDEFPEAALAAANAADQAVRDGAELGPLHGVPVTIKINVDYAGRATTNGVVAFKNVIAQTDSPPVANWRKAGAIPIGRTNVPAFSTRYFTDNDLHGRTLNPFGAHITPGGSSGGTASAVASGMGALGHGNDRAGSIRYPAYACGIYGIRPTLGRVPAFNGSAKDERTLTSQLTSVQGPLARSIADLRVGLSTMAEEDPRDPWWTPVRDRPAEVPVRVAMVAGAPGAPVSPAIAQAVRQAATWLTNAGYEVDEVTPPRFDEAAELFFSLLMTEERESSQSTIDKLGDDAVRRARGATLTYAPHLQSMPDYIAAQARRATILREVSLFLERYPLLLLPVSWQPPLPVGTDQQGESAVHAMLDAHRPLVAISILGLPGLAVPTGLADGVPVGVQLVGGRFREELCFKAGEAIEAQNPLPTPIDPR
jgi:amidase